MTTTLPLSPAAAIKQKPRMCFQRRFQASPEPPDGPRAAHRPPRGSTTAGVKCDNDTRQPAEHSHTTHRRDPLKDIAAWNPPATHLPYFLLASHHNNPRHQTTHHYDPLQNIPMQRTPIAHFKQPTVIIYFWNPPSTLYPYNPLRINHNCTSLQTPPSRTHL